MIDYNIKFVPDNIGYDKYYYNKGFKIHHCKICNTVYYIRSFNNLMFGIRLLRNDDND